MHWAYCEVKLRTHLSRLMCLTTFETQMEHAKNQLWVYGLSCLQASYRKSCPLRTSLVWNNKTLRLEVISGWIGIKSVSKARACRLRACLRPFESVVRKAARICVSQVCILLVQWLQKALLWWPDWLWARSKQRSDDQKRRPNLQGLQHQVNRRRPS